jgi:GH18 family chitinase
MLQVFLRCHVIVYIILLWLLQCHDVTPNSVLSNFANKKSKNGNSTSNSFQTMGYWLDSSTHINMTTASEPSESSSGDIEQCCLSSHQLEFMTEHKKLQRKRKVERIWITVGGIRRSQFFQSSLDKTNQTKYLWKNLLSFCQKYNIQGVNLYWDDPRTYREFLSYNRFILKTADILHRHGLLLSVTTRQFLDKPVMDVLDFLLLAAYDLLPPRASSEETTNQQSKHHASMEYVKILLDNILEFGNIPPSRLILGIPGYARHENQIHKNVRTFGELVIHGYRSWNQSNYQGYYLDSPHQIQQKVIMAKRQGLAGVFLWELGHDIQVQGAPAGVLLQAIADIATQEQEVSIQSIAQKDDWEKFQTDRISDDQAYKDPKEL